MSVYPVLNVNSLTARCQRDIEQFKREQNITQSQEAAQKLTTEFAGATVVSIKAVIDGVKPKFKEDGDPSYVDNISKIATPEEQQELWIARTYLVYQLLIILTVSLTDKTLYDAIFLGSEAETLGGGGGSIFKLPFRSDVNSETLEAVKLGIFGSLTPTSDIDIGFQYSGTAPNYSPCLAYVVSRFELLFLIFTGKSCLDYDVESYADMITVPNTDPATKDKVPDLFYLNTSKLTWDSDVKTQLLPIAFNSIARNAMIDLDGDGSATKTVGLKDVISQFMVDTGSDAQSGQAYRIKIEAVEITGLMDDTVADTQFKESQQTVSKFLNAKYTDQIQQYYDSVFLAESMKVETLKGKTTVADLQTLNSNDIIKLIVAIGNSLTLRKESYTCSPTVVHVVRVLQAEGQKIAMEGLINSEC